jgi:hypothetical protein
LSTTDSRSRGGRPVPASFSHDHEWRLPYYFVLAGNICAFQAARTHVNVFLYDGAIVGDPDGIITGGHDNRTARTVAVHEGGSVPTGPLLTMFRQIVANNRAGGWRKLKGNA